jgi:hypothetical protein
MFRVTTRLRFIEPQLPSLVDQPLLTVEVKHLSEKLLDLIDEISCDLAPRVEAAE